MNPRKLRRMLIVDVWAKELHFTKNIFDKDYSKQKLGKVSINELSRKVGILIFSFILGIALPFFIAFYMDPYWFVNLDFKPPEKFGYGDDIFGSMSPFWLNSFVALIFGTVFSTKTKHLSFIFAPMTVFGYGNGLAFLLAFIRSDTNAPVEIIAITCITSVLISLFFAIKYPKKRLKFKITNLPIKSPVLIAFTFLAIRYIAYVKTGEELSYSLFATEPFSIYATFVFFSIGTIIFYREFDYISEKLDKKWPRYISWYLAQKIVLWFFVYLFFAFCLAITKTKRSKF
jgi:hypothetical protein